MDEHDPETNQLECYAAFETDHMDQLCASVAADLASGAESKCLEKARQGRATEQAISVMGKLALDLASSGYPVFPCNPGNKHPYSTNGFKDATTDPSRIREWWLDFPQAMPGLPTGAPSGLLVLDVDVDVQKDLNGRETLRDLEERHGALPATLRVNTPRGGFHLYFRHPGHRVKNSAGRIGMGLDMRGDGGYVIACGARAVTGCYQKDDHSPHDPADLPAWLLELVTQPKPASRTSLQAVPAHKLAEGEGRNNRLTQIGGALRRLAVSDDGVCEALKAVNSTEFHVPLDTSEVMQVARSVSRYPPHISHLPNPEAADARAPLRVVRASDWASPEPPAREWHVQDWVPANTTTALYGDGGVGKSLLAQQLLTCTVAGLPFFGADVRRGPVLGFFCEDTEDELHRRQVEINKGLNVPWDQLDELHLVSMVGQDNLLMTFDGRTQGQLTNLWYELDAQCGQINPALLVIDTAADTFGGNEIVRSQVRQFIQRALTALAMKHNAAVLLCAHPSLTGKSSGEGTGGSTAWSNSVRARLYLERDESTGTIVLTRKKANYASRGAEIRLRWCNGAFFEDNGRLHSRSESVCDWFLHWLATMNANDRNVSAAPSANNYGVKMFADSPIGKENRISRSEAKDAMDKLLSDDRIFNEKTRKGTRLLVTE